MATDKRPSMVEIMYSAGPDEEKPGTFIAIVHTSTAFTPQGVDSDILDVLDGFATEEDAIAAGAARCDAIVNELIAAGVTHMEIPPHRGGDA